MGSSIHGLPGTQVQATPKKTSTSVRNRTEALKASETQAAGGRNGGIA